MADRGGDADMARYASRPARGGGFEWDAEQLHALQGNRDRERPGWDARLPDRHRPESRACLRRLRRQHNPADLPADQLQSRQAAAANRDDDWGRAKRRRRQLGMVLRWLVERGWRW